MSVFPVSEHEQQFDRQTRLWGSHGQMALEQGHVCCLFASAVCAETLKNLVLANVGRFTLVDDAILSKDDASKNFFGDFNRVGEGRAAVVADNLAEMNPNVKIEAVKKSPLEIIEKDKDFFKRGGFQLVIAGDLPERAALELDKILQSLSIPLLYVRSYGMIGYLRVSVGTWPVVETHYPKNERRSLYIHPEELKWFPELEKYCSRFDLTFKPDDGDALFARNHIPYIAILVQMGKQWAASGKYPTTMDEKSEFKRSIIQTASQSGMVSENFQEAESNARFLYSKPELHDDVVAVLKHPLCENVNNHSNNFWLLARALRNFIASDGHGLPPVTVDLPDMTSKTQDFVELQAIFKVRAAHDLQVVRKHVHSLLAGLSLPAGHIPDVEIEYFVNNFRGIKCTQMRTLADEYDSKTALKDYLNEVIYDPVDPLPFKLCPIDLYWYFGLRAVDRFHAAHGRYPGKNVDKDTDSLAKDTQELVKIQQTLFEELQFTGQLYAECLEEMSRYGATDVHNIGAVMGGIASQEALKILIRQFKVINNTVLYNGIHARVTAYEL